MFNAMFSVEKKKKKKNILEHSSVKQEFIISFLFIITGSGKI